MFGEDNVCKVNTLHVSVGVTGMFGKVGYRDDSVEGGVDGEEEIEGHVSDFHLTLAYLLGSDAAVGREKMLNEIVDVVPVTTGGGVEERL